MKRPIFRTPDKNHVLSAPPYIHLELTTGCTQKCRHCYNFWRTDHYTPENMSREKLDFIIDEIIKNKVMHVVLSGGEPFLNFENLVYAIEKLTSHGISVSVNSNLSLATPEKIKRLKDAGLPHILTSLDSYDEKTNDFITHTPGSLKKIVEGIKATVNGGIRVSINMVVCQYNIDQIYETARLANELGCHNFNITRTIPIPAKDSPDRKEFVIGLEEAKKMIDVGLLIEHDFNFDKVSTMIPFPYCFLGDLKKYEIFLEKCSCTAGTKLMSINVNGDCHACVHESKVYGNVFKDGLQGAWKKLIEWHEGMYFPEGCKKCDFFDQCVSGCRMAARAYDKIDGYDNLRIGSKNIINPIALSPTKEMYESVEKDEFIVVPNIRFRKENNFYYVTTFGAKGVIVESNVAETLKKLKELEGNFTLKTIGEENRENLAYCLFYGLIERADDVESKRKRAKVNEFVAK